jgi:hypothetical protein
VKRITTGRARRRSITRRLALAVVVATFFVPACGKKGPPRPPLVRLPARPEAFAARRLGAVAYLQVQVPAANSDGTTPADIQRVDVYGFTGQPPAREDLFKYGTVVASVPVRKPAEAAPAPKEKGKGKGNEAGKGKSGGRPETWPAPPPRPAPSIQNGFDQGDMVVVTEPIGQAQLADVVIPPKPGVVAAPAPEKPSTPTRFYVAVGVNHKGQKGAVSGRQAVALELPPPAPSDLAVTHTETTLTLVWTPAAGTAAFNVYDVPAGPPVPEGVKIPTSPAAAGQLPVPVNAKPVPGPAFVDSRLVFGTPRCYVVRAVSVFGTQAIESEASPARCVTPIDTFPPAAPASLTAIGGAGSISLIWEASREPDLGGYLVMRATLPGGDFGLVTPAPIAQTTFTDTTVARGARYAYVVLAVDKAGNRSARSNRVEEAAR